MTVAKKNPSATIVAAPPVPSIGATLTSRAMLSDLTVSIWSGRKYDKAISDEVADQHNAAKDAGRYNKRLIAKDALADLQKVSRAAFQTYYAATLPWADSGLRVFPSELFFDFTSKMNAYEREFAVAADRFASVYPQVVADAQRDLNGLFNAADYPTASTIRERFDFHVTMMPLPDATDFRVDLGDDAVARLQADWRRAQDALVGAAIADVVGRIKDVVGRMSERLHAYKVTDGKTEGVFRDTLVTNVRDLAAILPALNLTDDARLADLIEQVRSSLCKHDADVLRENDTARTETADAADTILDHVSAFFA